MTLLAAAPPALAEKRVALVIGNSAYRHVPRLANPANDARLMAETLRSLGFTLVGGGAQLDLDKAGFDAAVLSFGNQLQGANVGLFYYAGHGVQVRGANYLVPVGANPSREADVDFQMLDTTLVLRQMESAGTQLNLVILDACRNNPLGGRGLRTTAPGLATMQAPEGTLISFATQPGNVAQDGVEGNSPYTKALAQTIRRPGLALFDAFNAVGLAVKKATGGAQQPWVSSSPIAGTFYFAGVPSGVSPSPAPAPPPSAVPAIDPAAQAWALTKDTTSIAVLEDFIRQFGDTVYGSLARVRVAELKRSAALTPSIPPSPPRDQSPPPSRSDRYGAIALSKNSLAWGEGQNYLTQAEAETRAMAECSKHARDCEKLRWVRNACHALALGKRSWGHGWNADLNHARSAALSECRKREANCSITYSGCSFAQ